MRIASYIAVKSAATAILAVACGIIIKMNTSVDGDFIRHVPEMLENVLLAATAIPLFGAAAEYLEKQDT